MISFANGKYVATENLVLPVVKDPLGTFRGFRIFTACRTVGQKVFCLEDHIERLFNSAKAIYMDLPQSKQGLREIIQETVAQNKERRNGELLLEIIYSGGQATGSGLAPAGQADLYIDLLQNNFFLLQGDNFGCKLSKFRQHIFLFSYMFPQF